MDWSLVIEISKPVISAGVGLFIGRAIERRAKLVTFYGHVSSFNLQGQNPMVVNTHALIVRNTGRLSCNNVRVSHNVVVPNVTIYPNISHTRNTLSGGGEEILFPVLVPGEQVTISYLYFPPLTWNLINSSVRSDEGLAKVLNVLPTPQLPAWAQRTFIGLFFLGLIAGIYLLAEVGLWLTGKLSS